MKAFDLDRKVLESYQGFSRSFSTIRAPDIASAVDAQYAEGRFWPDALLSLNPAFKRGKTSDELADSGVILPETAQVFRAGGAPFTFHLHQEQAISTAAQGKSLVVTTGTGSGKSLCFFVPIIDACIRARKAGEGAKTRAIIVYPMNALANSQLGEVNKFLTESGLPDDIRPTVARYTGQENAEERQAAAANPPDILLTNFMMLELLLTRQDAQDKTVIANAKGLRFIVLDELHTYRGRQGADVAVLVRRLRDRTGAKALSIGTSATMANEGREVEIQATVAAVASKIFGADIGVDAVIGESLRRATDDAISLEKVMPYLAAAMGPLPDHLPDAVLRQHPLAIWSEMALGLDNDGALKRRKPVAFGDAVTLLSQASGIPAQTCRPALEAFLTRASLPEHARGGTHDRAFLAFKLHRFISGSGEVFTTLRPAPRNVYLEGQLNDPKAPTDRLYTARFCRECGQEFYPVTRAEEDGQAIYLPRPIDEEPRNDGEVVAGYLMPKGTEDQLFDGSATSLPEDWQELRPSGPAVKPSRRDRVPLAQNVTPDGRITDEGQPFWFLPGRFAFCPACHDQPSPNSRERSKLGGLSAEGRSSATTTIATAILEALNDPDQAIPEAKRKLLGFTDNRQDAALQAGHFNDFLFVSLLRGAILRAVQDTGGLEPEDFGRRVAKALGFTSQNAARRGYWMAEPEKLGQARLDAEKTLTRVLSHLVWTDLRRGWRFTNPSLSVLKLIGVDYPALADLCHETARFDAVHPALGALKPEARKAFCRAALDVMLEALAVQTEDLNPLHLDPLAQKSRHELRSPWSMERDQDPRQASALILNPPGKADTRLRDEVTILRGGARSRIGKAINQAKWFGEKLKADDYLDMVERLLALLREYGLLTDVMTGLDLPGWQLAPSAVRLVPGPALADPTTKGNAYFHDLYTGIAGGLGRGEERFLGFEGREHTAQVTQKLRQWREARFRRETADLAYLKDPKNLAELAPDREAESFLPALFCSPTMELGVDISALNAVYLRNVPPTPANYAQRAGRAGRSGQAALVVTYCAAQSPHDQYFFNDRQAMVAGSVRAPALDITNEQLITSHLHAVWMAEAGLVLAADIPHILDLTLPGAPLRAEIAATAQAPELPAKAIPAMTRVLTQVMGETLPPWMEDAQAFVARVAAEAPRMLDHAFDRWRGLYGSAQEQLKQANDRSMQTGLSGADRQRIKAAQAQANEQLGILEQGKQSNGSDFYSYRYLATEGFLPGYNFPRLPLYAWVPGAGGAGAFLQRARFLAISEFGPRSLIYHEGRAYRVHRAKLAPGAASDDGTSLSTQRIIICPECGAAHEDDRELCHACGTPLVGAPEIKKALRIDNVETLPADRITANDEERVRQGFEIQTVFAWALRDGRRDTWKAQVHADGAPLLALQYGQGAEISRLNLGLKRRANKDLTGFGIDPQSGRWVALPGEGEEEPAAAPDQAKALRIVPIVKDNKNALHLRFAGKPPSAGVMATVQQALLRAIERSFQLEEGEMLGEPLPARTDRRALLFYEATEGGAGVLARLAQDPSVLPALAREALKIMHLDGIEAAIAAKDASLLVETDVPCVKGCYRCLLSYFNQPDHELIDRTDTEVRALLIALARGDLRPEAKAAPMGDIPPPDNKPLTLAGLSLTAWRSHRLALFPAPIPPEAQAEADERGWTLLAQTGDDLPPGLADLLKD
ncbi:DEAD/DEAH box helicase [Rhodobacter sp. KR11]|uniref:DEAD/DEAH box helicase n=1 Tax=Rhodobacter sp. KR11 TaxID=2974588 RepID=UPI0022224D71|nr:DEAD/DEAH box helicase [Rhodobacter sp. KR11]MCW1919231.1 DEAD/DEAH box helicase [Rhodobacter sp. KR11]